MLAHTTLIPSVDTNRHILYVYIYMYIYIYVYIYIYIYIYRNDIWSKRMNTLRFFISAVSTWIVRARAGKRLAKIQAKLAQIIGSMGNGIRDGIQTLDLGTTGFGGTGAGSTGKIKKSVKKQQIELVRAYIDAEANLSKQKATTASLNTMNQQKDSENLQFDFKNCETVARLVCAADHEAVVKRQQSEYLIKTNRFELTSQVDVQRILFPKYIADEGNNFQPLPTQGMYRNIYMYIYICIYLIIHMYICVVQMTSRYQSKVCMCIYIYTSSHRN
jgi:hypothetical protein